MGDSRRRLGLGGGAIQGPRSPQWPCFSDVGVGRADRDARIASADLVISMLPAFMHPEVASVAIEAGVHVLTPSYVSDDMQALDARAKEKGFWC